MTHEQHAKKFIKYLLLAVHGYEGDKERKNVDEFFRHMKEAITKDIKCTCNCQCPSRKNV